MATLYTAREGFEAHRGYLEICVEDTPSRRVEVFRLPEGSGTPLRFNSMRDEVFVFSTPTLFQVGGEMLRRSASLSIPRGVLHRVVPESRLRSYTVIATGDLAGGVHTGDDPLMEFSYGIYEVNDPVGQTLALQAMNQVGRWQKERETALSDPEQYILRALSGEVKIFVFYRNSLWGYELAGAAFVGAVEGYDLPKTRAMLEYGGADSALLQEDALWLNYQSWEELPGRAPTALAGSSLLDMWDAFCACCKDAFPSARQIVVRSRHCEVWSYVYTAPWEVLAEVDLRGFEWTDPDGKRFAGYDERFSRYGILALPLT